MTEKQLHLTRGRRLARNVIWNLLGAGVPLLVAVVAFPLLIKGLGLDRFGVLTLAWMLIGYFSMFDLGLGRALTKLVAERLGNGQSEDIPALIWTGILLMTFLGVLGALVVVVFAPWLVGGVLKIPPVLQEEALCASYVLAISIPIVTSTVGLRGVLEAHQVFGAVNAVRIPLGIMTFLGPLAVLPYSNNLVPVVAVLVGVRVISCVAYAVLCAKLYPVLRQSFLLDRNLIKPLLRFGSWMTVSNIISPIMVSFDRFLIGSFVSIAAVAYYTTPYELVTRLRIFPTAFAGVLFPAFSSSLRSRPEDAARLYRRGLNILLFCLFPLVLAIVTYARVGLELWVGTDFANNSFVVLQYLAVGVFVNSLATLPFSLIQSSGRADITAKIHLVEFPFYLFFILFFINKFGIIGVAFIWFLRSFFDMLILFYCSTIIDKKVSKLYSYQVFTFFVFITMIFLVIVLI